MSVEAYLGEIRMFAGTFPPKGWAFCDGQLLPIGGDPQDPKSTTRHQALFSLLGTSYGGDGRTTFALPDLRGRVPVHSGGGSAGPGLGSYPLGQRGGSEFNYLTASQLPKHSHAIKSSSDSAGGTADLGVYDGKADTDKPAEAKSLASGGTLGLSSVSYLSKSPSNSTVKNAVINIKGGGVPDKTENAGAGDRVSNVQPYVAINFIICLEGIFPARS